MKITLLSVDTENAYLLIDDCSSLTLNRKALKEWAQGTEYYQPGLLYQIFQRVKGTNLNSFAAVKTAVDGTDYLT